MSTIEAHPAGASPMAPLLLLEHVEQRYGAFRPVLVGVDLSVARGDFVVIAGAGGCGKSVLLRLLAGLEAPAAGRLRIAGEDLARMRPRLRVHLRRSMGILPAGQCLLEQRSVEYNVALAAWVAGAGFAEGLRRAHAALAMVGIEVERHARTSCAQLASGERHCVAVARALVNRPALLLLDDLLSPLDAAGANRILQVIDQFCTAGVTVVATAREAPASAAALAAASGAQEAMTGDRTQQPWPARARMLRLRDGRLEA
jgi:ABC-type ATPase involved in cell division